MAFSGNGSGAFRSRRRGSATSLSEINVTPFVDVVLVLLIIFMLTAHVMEFGIQIDVPKVVDFGLVKDLSGGEVSLTATSSVTGTPTYMSPETITAPGTVDARSDLYALGAVGYFLVTGSHVFPGHNLIEICGHHLHTKPQPPSARLGRPLPQDIEALLLECLEKDPRRRPQTASELQDRVRGCRAYGAWDRERARCWWDENGSKLRRVRADSPTLSRVGPPGQEGRP